jgi:hypothetical protein
MKTAVFFLSLWLAFGFSSNADTGEEIELMRRSVSLVGEGLKNSSIPIPDFPDADIWGHLILLPEFGELLAVSRQKWKILLEYVDQIAPDRQTRLIILHSLADLTPGDYLAAADKALDLMMVDKIKKDEFLYTILMSPNQKRWFFSYNFENPSVVSFLKRVKLVFSEDKDVVGLVEFIVSGSAKTRDDFLRKENSMYAAQPIPLLSLVSPSKTRAAHDSQVESIKKMVPRPDSADNASESFVGSEKVDLAWWRILCGALLSLIAVSAILWRGRKARK